MTLLFIKFFIIITRIAGLKTQVNFQDLGNLDLKRPSFEVLQEKKHSTSDLDRVSVPSPIAVDILMVHNGEGQSSLVLVFCVNFEQHICRHITTSIKCYLHSLRYVYVPFTNILCQSNWHVYI